LYTMGKASMANGSERREEDECSDSVGKPIDMKGLFIVIQERRYTARTR